MDSGCPKDGRRHATHSGPSINRWVHADDSGYPKDGWGRAPNSVCPRNRRGQPGGGGYPEHGRDAPGLGVCAASGPRTASSPPSFPQGDQMSPGCKIRGPDVSFRDEGPRLLGGAAPAYSRGPGPSCAGSPSVARGPTPPGTGAILLRLKNGEEEVGFSRKLEYLLTV